MPAMQPNATPGESEFSHGPGLRPKHLRDAPVSSGGVYSGAAASRELQHDTGYQYPSPDDYELPDLGAPGGD